MTGESPVSCPRCGGDGIDPDDPAQRTAKGLSKNEHMPCSRCGGSGEDDEAKSIFDDPRPMQDYITEGGVQAYRPGVYEVPRTGDLVKVNDQRFEVAAHVIESADTPPGRVDVHLVLMPEDGARD